MVNRIACIVISSAVLGLFLELAWFPLPIVNTEAQKLALENMYIKVTSPTENQKVPAGQLTIKGISSDNANTDCQVYVDWNDLKPYQKVVPADLSGQNDYSNWTFTYTSSYHLIIQGLNELTAKLSCAAAPNQNMSKWYSINVTGVAAADGETQQQASIIEDNADNIPPSSQIPLAPSTGTATGEVSIPHPVDEAENKVEEAEAEEAEDEEDEEANGGAIGDLFK